MLPHDLHLIDSLPPMKRCQSSRPTPLAGQPPCIAVSVGKALQLCWIPWPRRPAASKPLRRLTSSESHIAGHWVGAGEGSAQDLHQALQQQTCCGHLPRLLAYSQAVPSGHAAPAWVGVCHKTPGQRLSWLRGPLSSPGPGAGRVRCKRTSASPG